LDESSSTGKKLSAWYKQHGIELKDETGNQQKLYTTLTEVSKIWNQLSSDEQAYYLNIQAGANQTQNLSSILSNFNQVLNAHDLALNSSGSAVDENARAMENLNKKIDAVKAAWERFTLAITDSKEIGELLDDVAEGLDKIASNEKAVDTIVTLAKTLLALKGFSIAKNIFLGTITSLKELGSGAITTAKGLAKVIKQLGLLPRYVATIKDLGLSEGLTWLKGAVPWIGKLSTALAALAPWLVLLAGVGISSGKFKEWYNEFKLANTDDLNEQAEALENLVTTYKEYKHARKGTGSKKVSGSEAVDTYIEQLKTLNKQYKDGEITAQEYMDKLGDISALENYYNKLEEIVSSGGTLTDTQKTQYTQLKKLFATYNTVSSEIADYNKAMELVKTYTDSSTTVTTLFADSLTVVGGKYQFVSAEAKKAAEQQLTTEMELTKATLAQVSTRMSARLAEYGSYQEYTAALFKNASPTAAGNYANSTEGKQVLALSETYYAIKKALKQVKSMKVVKSGVTSDTTTTDDDESTKNKKKAQSKLESYKKKLEKYQEAQKEAYQKGEITADQYYSNVEKRGKKYYNALKAKGEDYADAAKDMLEEYQSTNTQSVKDIFDEIEYHYKQGTITAEQYYNNIWKYAKKFYKNGKLEFEEYRDYIEDGYEALFDSLEDDYENGKITAEQYSQKVTDATNKALEKIASSGLSSSVKKQLKTLLNTVTKEAQKSVKKALAQAAVDAAEAAVDAAEKEVEAAEKRQEKAEAYIDALDFYAQEQQDAIDKIIDGYNAEIDKLNEKKELLDEQNEALDDQAERIKLVNELEDAKKQKTVRVYDESLGWIWVADPERVQNAQEALDEFDTQKKRKEEEKAIDDQIKAIEDLIDAKEAEKQAYQDVIDAQVKALERYNIESELGKTIEQSIFADRVQNFTNWKNAYLTGMDEVIAAIGNVQAAQDQLEALQLQLEVAEQALEEAEQEQEEQQQEQQAEQPTIITGKTSVTGAEYSYSSTATAAERKAAKVEANAAARIKEGYDVEITRNSDNLATGYKIIGTKNAKADATPVKSVQKSTKSKASGSFSIPQSGIYNVNELGDELIIPPKGNFDYLKKGTGVIPADLTKNLMDWGKYNPSSLLNNQANVVTNDHSITIQNLTVQSNNAQDFVRQLQNLAVLRK
jgi:hypothetical protein